MGKRILRSRWMQRVMAFIMLVTSVSVLPVSVHADPEVLLDGERLRFDVPPVIIHGSTMVPMRKIFEELGARIDWNNQTKTVAAYQDDVELTYTIGESAAYKNGVPMILASTPGQIIEGRVLVPLRFVSESLGAYVGYEGHTQTVVIKRDHVAGTGHPSPLNQYRMTLPYHTILQDAPSLIAYMNEHSRKGSYVFFGDSLTWGSHLGRAEVHPYFIQMKTGRSAFNLGVPGFTDDQLVDFIPYALKHNEVVDAVIQLQYFWDEETSYTGLAELLRTPAMDYASALEQIKHDLDQDEAYADPAQVPYLLRDDAFRQERISRGKELFPQGSRLSAGYRDALTTLAEWMAGRPAQTFYVYMPPYFMDQVERHSPMNRVDYEQKVSQIQEIFADAPNVQFKDFNQLENTWEAGHFIDWWHRTKAGEEELARQLMEWLAR